MNRDVHNNPLDRAIVTLAGRYGSRAKEVERFLRFSVVGVFGAVVDLGILTILQATLLPPVTDLHVQLATGTAFLAAVVHNFAWNRYWTYPDSRTRSIRRQLSQFALVNAVGLVVAIDSLITGNLANISHLEGNPGFRFIRHDVTRYITFEEPLDVVFHFASPASPVDYVKLPIQTLKASSLGTHNALGLARARGASFVLASTSEVYGDPQVHPQHESYVGHVDTLGPRGVYDNAKRYAEALTMAFHRVHGIDTRIVRIFNTYGPRMRLEDGRVVPNFIAQSLRGEPLTIYGDGTQTRSFQFISDLIEGVWRLLQSNYHDPVNIGNPREMNILEFAHVVNELTDNPAGITFREDNRMTGDPQTRQPDISRARTLLGWEPQIELPEGLQETIEFFRNVM